MCLIVHSLINKNPHSGHACLIMGKPQQRKCETWARKGCPNKKMKSFLVFYRNLAFKHFLEGNQCFGSAKTHSQELVVN